MHNATPMPATSRRALLGAAAAAPLAALPAVAGTLDRAAHAASAAPLADARLIRVCAEFQQLHQKLQAADNRTLDLDDDEMDEINDAWWAALHDGIGLPARTPEGLRAKAAMALAAMVLLERPCRGDVFDDVARADRRLVASVLRDVTGEGV